MKIRPKNINQTLEIETTHQIRATTVQPLGNAPNASRRAYRVIGPECRRGCIKTEPRNISRTQNAGRTYLGCVNAIQSIWKPKKDVRRLDRLTMESRTPGEPWREDGRLEIEHISINPAGEDEITYHVRARLAQPPRNDSKRAYMVIGPRRRCGRIKTRPRNVNQTEKVENTYLGRINAI